ncbi:MAG: capsid cement protein [Gammaproteobacteria bacterium]
MSREELIQLALTFTASGAVTQYRAVGYDGAQASVAGQRFAGAAPPPAADGEDLTVNMRGVIPFETGGAFSKGDPLTVDAEGRVVAASNLAIAAGGTAVTSTAANGEILEGSVTPETIFGEAREDSAGAGEIRGVIR